MTGDVAPATRPSPLALLAAGRVARGVAAWLAAVVAAALLGSTLTVGFVLVREIVLHPPFPASEWWVFFHLWRPLLIAGAALAVVLSGPLAALSVWSIRQARWPRPLADIVAGGVCGLVALAALVLIARGLGPMGDTP